MALSCVDLRICAEVPFRRYCSILFLLSLCTEGEVIEGMAISTTEERVRVPFGPGGFTDVATRVAVTAVPLDGRPAVTVFNSSATRGCTADAALVPTAVGPEGCEHDPIYTWFGG